MATPKLRFKEFDGDWSQVKLKDLVLSLDAGVSVNGEDVSVTEDDFSVLKTSCVSLGTFNPDERKKVTLEHEIQRLKQPLLDNSLVMNRSNTPLLVGSSAFIKKAPKKTYLSDKLWQFKVNQNANIQWIAFYFSNETTLTKLRDMATGTSNSMKNITKPDVLNIDLFAPQKAEQTKIASFLSSVDEKISQLTQKHELLSQYKQGMMQKLFSQQIRFKADDGSEFGEWEEISANELFENYSNKDHDGTLTILAATQDKGIVPRDEIDIDIKSSDASVLSYKIIEKGSFVISLRSFQGGIEYSNYYGICSPAYTILSSLRPIASEFYKNYLKTNDFIQRLSATVVGIRDGKQISYQAFSTLNIDYPSVEEQTKIANFLSAIDQKIEVVAQQIEQAKTWKKGLLQQMFV